MRRRRNRSAARSCDVLQLVKLVSFIKNFAIEENILKALVAGQRYKLWLTNEGCFYFGKESEGKSNENAGTWIPRED